MAKGIPLMGRGPDGKAKMINVDENGNVKVQLSGTIVSEGEVNVGSKKYVPVPAGPSDNHIVKVLEVPSSVKHRIIIVTDDYVYIGGDNRRVRQYTKDKFLYTGVERIVDFEIYSAVTDGSFIYVAGRGGKYAKLNLTTLELEGNGRTEGNRTILGIALENGYLYTAGFGGTGSPLNRVDVDTLVSETIGDYEENLHSVAAKEDYVYVGTSNAIRKIEISTGTTVAISPAYGAEVKGLAIDYDFLYAVGNNQTIAKYNISDLSLVAESDPLGYNLRRIKVLDDTILVDGVISNDRPGRITRHSKYNLETKAESSPFKTDPMGFAFDDTYIYAIDSATSLLKFAYQVYDQIGWMEVR